MSSPLPPTPIKSVPSVMTFGEAMELVAQAKRVRRVEWPEGDYLFLRAEFVHVHRTTDYPGDHILKLSLGDIAGTDWVEVETIN